MALRFAILERALFAAKDLCNRPGEYTGPAPQNLRL
jgi:hypothetical protein